MMILIAAGFLSLGLVNLNFGPTWRRGQYIRLVVGLPIVLFYAYTSMPALVFPQALTYLLLTLVPNAVYTTLTAAREAVVFRHVVSLRRISVTPYAAAIAALGVFAGALFLAPILDASGLRDIPQVTVSVNPPPNASLRHVRVVPLESAIFAGEKVIGQLGAYYFVGDYNIQVENGR
jgi:hypothetical protein